MRIRYLIGEKKVGEKWRNFLQVTKFFPDEIFSDFLFPDQYFSLIFFHLTKNLSQFFFQFSLLLFFPIYLQNLLSTCFYYVLYLSWLSKAVLKNILKCEWNQGTEKNNNNNYINTTRNCTFVNFKNYTTLKASKRIGFKLVLIISRTKERVFNSFKDFVRFFDRLCYSRWFKAIQNQITAPSQVLVHLIDPFCV